MCVIAHQPVGAHISKEEAALMWKANPDGGGFAYVDDASIVQVVKSMTFPAFWSEFEHARSTFPQRDFLLHMRIATHGEVNIDNVHPFPVGKNTVMAHNGILHMVTGDVPQDNSVSDTRVFIDNVLAEMPKDWLEKPYLVEMMENYIGWSRLMFLSPDGVARLGRWDYIGGCYYSNDHHIPKTPVNYGGGYFPGNYKQTPNYENNYGQSDDWPGWELDDKGGGASAYSEWQRAKALEGKKPVSRDSEDLINFWEFEMLMNDIKKERIALGLIKPILVIDEAELQIECTACLMEINIDDATCECWTIVCLACFRFVAECEDLTACVSTAHVEYANLTKGAQKNVKTKPASVAGPDGVIVLPTPT